MIFRLATLLFLFALAGCLGIQHRDKTKSARKSQPHDMADQSNDLSFQAFLGRLRTAVRMHDMATMAAMMTPNFGYSLDPVREGDGVFQYWDENNTWRELELVLREKFVPHGDYMVAPPQFAESPDTFTGYRAGIRLINGSWKFAYFVNSPSGESNVKR